MTTRNAETATLAALAKTRLAKRALEEAAREQHEQHRDALERLAQAERERAEAIAEASKPIPALREAHAEARGRLHAAARCSWRNPPRHLMAGLRLSSLNASGSDRRRS